MINVVLCEELYSFVSGTLSVRLMLMASWRMCGPLTFITSYNTYLHLVDRRPHVYVGRPPVVYRITKDER